MARIETSPPGPSPRATVTPPPTSAPMLRNRDASSDWLRQGQPDVLVGRLQCTVGSVVTEEVMADTFRIVGMEFRTTGDGTVEAEVTVFLASGHGEWGEKIKAIRTSL